MSNRMKQKGTEWETAVVRYLQSRGLAAYRKAQTGMKDTADIGIHSNPDIALEAKNEKAYRFADYVEQAIKEAWHAGSPFGFAVVKRHGKGDAARGYVVTDLETFADLLLEIEELRATIEELEA